MKSIGSSSPQNVTAALPPPRQQTQVSADDLTDVYQVADLLGDAIRSSDLPARATHCTEQIQALRDPQSRAEFAKRLLDDMTRHGNPGQFIWQCSSLAQVLVQHGKEQLASALLGKLLIRATASGNVLAKSNFPYRSNLIKLFRNPAISANDKATAATQIAGEMQHGDIENPLHACSLVRGIAPFMSRADSAAAVRRLAYVLIPPNGPMQERADRIIAIADLLAGLEDDDTRRELSAMLKSECDRTILANRSDTDIPRMMAERIRLDPDNALRHLADLLEFDLRNAPEEFRDDIAIATFQADPQSNAYVPGTEVVNTKKNPLSGSYIDRGTKFGYPLWLVQRRAELREFARRAGGLNGRICGGAMHGVQALAQVSRHDAGIWIRSSDWPRLREHLKALHEEARYIPKVRWCIANAMRAPDPVPLLKLLQIEFLSCPADERARILPEVLGVYAQRGGEAPQQCLQLLVSCLSSSLASQVLCNTEISSATLGHLIDRIVLPGSTDSMLNATYVCSKLLGAQHEDITPLYRLASTLIDRVARNEEPAVLSDSVAMIEAIPDPRLHIVLAQQAIANRPDLGAQRMESLISVAKTLKTPEELEVGGLHLGKILVSTTASAIFLEQANFWRDVVPWFGHTAISGEDKTTALAQVAAGITSATRTFLDLDEPGAAATVAAPFMTQNYRHGLAHWLHTMCLPAIDNSEIPRISVISAMSALVAGGEGHPSSRQIQELVKGQCKHHVRFNDHADDKAVWVAELIRLDPQNGLRILPNLLERLRHIQYKYPERLNLIAIATFQADPLGEAFVPGSEVVDVLKNPLSDSYIDRGTKFVYPDWLATRRAELQRFSQLSSARLAAQIHQDIPLNVRALAQIEEAYTGISVQPRDWPALGAHLRAVFPIAR